MCLEQMHDVIIPKGAIYYGKTRRRENVSITSELKTMTQNTCNAMHTLYRTKITPKPIETNSCKLCSLKDICQPKIIYNNLKRHWGDALDRNKDDYA
jgi:CRISPR-associated exonuclease Cas4